MIGIGAETVLNTKLYPDDDFYFSAFFLHIPFLVFNDYSQTTLLYITAGPIFLVFYLFFLWQRWNKHLLDGKGKRQNFAYVWGTLA